MFLLFLLLSLLVVVSSEKGVDGFLDDLDDEATDHFDTLESHSFDDADDDGESGGKVRPAAAAATSTPPASSSGSTGAATRHGDDEEELPFDDDEFIGADVVKSRKPKENARKVTAAPPSSPPSNVGITPAVPFSVLNYIPELTGLILIFAYALNFFIGKRANEKAANLW